MICDAMLPHARDVEVFDFLLAMESGESHCQISLRMIWAIRLLLTPKRDASSEYELSGWPARI
jgi:hypothetical protein